MQISQMLLFAMTSVVMDSSTIQMLPPSSEMMGTQITAMVAMMNAKLSLIGSAKEEVPHLQVSE